MFNNIISCFFSSTPQLILPEPYPMDIETAKKFLSEVDEDRSLTKSTKDLYHQHIFLCIKLGLAERKNEK